MNFCACDAPAQNAVIWAKSASAGYRFSLSPSELPKLGVHQLAIARAKWPLRHEQVPHVWLVDPIAQTVEVFRLDGATYRFVAMHAGDETPRIEPFEAIELDRGPLE